MLNMNLNYIRRKILMNKDKGSVMVIDGENLLHRSFHKFLKLKSVSGKPSGAIFGFFKSLHYLVFRFKPKHVIVIFDNGRSSYRESVLPEYKGNRTKIGVDYESLQKQKRTIMRILKYLGIPYIFDKNKEFNYEGDDYIAYINSKCNEKVLIISSDKDFCQLINRSTKQYNPSKDTIINHKTCIDIMGFNPDECVDYLILVGDNSDNIKGLKGFGPVKTRKFLDKYPSIFNYLSLKDNPENIDKDELKLVYEKNRKLIDLNYFIRVNPLLKLPITQGTYNKDKLMTIFNKYSLTSFKTRDFTEILTSLKIKDYG